MESKLKAEAQDAVGELPNLLLREGGYPHLPTTPIKQEPKSDACKDCGGKGWIFSGFGEDHECETCFDKSPESENIVEQSHPDEWNEAGTKPDHPCLCRTRVYETDWPEYYNYWNGEFWGLTTATKKNAIDNKDVRTSEINIQWREVQP